MPSKRGKSVILSLRSLIINPNRLHHSAFALPPLVFWWTRSRSDLNVKVARGGYFARTQSPGRVRISRIGTVAATHSNWIYLYNINIDQEEQSTYHQSTYNYKHHIGRSPRYHF